jgi:hypothetical protein
MPEVIFSELGGESAQEVIIGNRRWRIAPGKAGTGFVGVSEDASSAVFAVWPDFPKDGEKPTLEIILSTANPPGWAPVDSKMNTGFAKVKYGVHWLAFAVLVYARQVAGTGKGF